jgi:heme/copper-type cytochrome/quinol oxidase subunit 4
MTETPVTKPAAGDASLTAPATSGNVIAKYLPVYFVLLAIAGLEIFWAYRDVSMVARLVVLLVMALFGAALALLYFMHLAQERPSLFLSLVPAAIFVLFMMNAFWTDSSRLLHMKPFAH